jgi:hypothetical protein
MLIYNLLLIKLYFYKLIFHKLMNNIKKKLIIYKLFYTSLKTIQFKHIFILK